MAIPERLPAERVVLLLHGVRTFGHWPDRFARILEEHGGVGGGLRAVIYRYGRLGMLVFFVPGLRHLLVLRLRRFLRTRSDLWPASRIDVVAHSFGTYLITAAIAGLAPSEGPAIDTMILTGSVLKQSYPWERLAAGGVRVRRVVNECGERDIWPIMAQIFVLGMGVGGRYGFAPAAPPPAPGLVCNRFFPDLAHNDFFTDEWMARHWLPLLGVAEEPAAMRPSARQPRWTVALERFVEPLKAIFWLLLLAALIVVLRG